MESNKEISIKIKNLLSKQLGIEPDDIQDEYSLEEDLHIGPVELSELLENLDKNGFDTTGIVLSNINTFADLVEYIAENEI